MSRTEGAHLRSMPQRGRLAQPAIRVSLVAAACLLVEAIIAKNVLDVRLDFIAQSAALWVFIGWQILGRLDRTAEVAAMILSVCVTAAVLLLYAF